MPKRTARQTVESRMPEFSDWAATIWNFGETAWREYRSAEFYVELLRREGFSVEVGSGGMPTAFCAEWSNGDGPTIGGYAEYDGIPGNCQAAEPRRAPRAGLSDLAGGHTDPHSALGVASLGGFLAAKAAMETHGIPGRLKFFGEPAEKLRGSKPIHAAAGYYDDLDAAISFHPFYMLPLCNTVRWDTHCGVGFAVMYSFRCDQPETWMTGGSGPIPAAHAEARAPGATDAVVQMYATAKALREHVKAAGESWSMNETILNTGQATADNIPAQMAQIMYFIRVSEIAEAEHIVRGLDHFAAQAAALTHCTWQRDWISKSRPGLANHVMARAAYENLETVGAPVWGAGAADFARSVQAELGLDPMNAPFLPDISRLTPPEAAEAALRRILPPTQRHFTSDDYTEYCWHAPTVRLYIGRPALAAPEAGYRYPAWVMNALGGVADCIDPMISVAAQVVAMTAIDCLVDARMLAAAKAEFVDRTGGGVGGANWIPPLCDYAPPIGYRWPEYVETRRGWDWVIPGDQATRP